MTNRKLKGSEKKKAIDLLRRWTRCQDFFRSNDTPTCCTVETCKASGFETGDVVFLFGDLESVIARRRYLCPMCGLDAATKGQFPAATLVYVDPVDWSMRFSELSEEIQNRIVEGFEYVDRIHRDFERRLAEILAKMPPGGEPN